MCAGCSPYLRRQDRIALSAGDAVAVNAATHVIDPWPARARDGAIGFDGAKQQRAIQSYHRQGPDSPAPAAGSTPTPNPAASQVSP